MATTAADVPDPADDPAEPERSARRSGRLVAAYVERWAARFAALPPASVHGAYGDGLRRQLTHAARAMRGDARALRGPQAASTAFLGDRCRALTVPLQEVGPRWRRLDPPSSLRAADAALMDAAGDVMLVLFECYRRAAPGAPWDVPDVLAGRAARRAEREYARAVRLMRVA